MKNLYGILANAWQKGFFHLLTANLLIGLVGFGSQLLVAKFLTEEELGYIKIFQSFIQIFSVVAGLGFSTSVLILAADPRNEKIKNEILQIGIIATIPISIIVLGLVVLLNNFGIWSQIDAVRELLNEYSFVIVFMAVAALFTAFLQSLRDFRKFSIIIIITQIFALVLITILTYLSGLKGYMKGLWLGYLVSLILMYFYTKNRIGFSVGEKISSFAEKLKDQFTLGIHGLGANLFGRIGANLDIILIGYFLVSDPKLVGQYSFAAIFLTALGMLQGTIVSITTPYFSKHQENVVTLKSLYNKYSFLLNIGVLVIAVIGAVSFPVIVNFLFGQKFQMGAYLLQFMIALWGVRCFNSINIAVLMATGKTKVTNYFNLLSVILIGVFIVVSLKWFGIIEMIISMIFTSLVLYLGLSLFVRNRILVTE